MNTDFLKYNRNGNIKYLHVDYNLINDLYVPPKVKILTASFNKLEKDNLLKEAVRILTLGASFNKLEKDNLESVCEGLHKCPELEEVDFSFNNVRKGTNYKLKLLSGNPKLKHIDGLKVTKIDREMME